jgi:hypothetical protein
MTSQIRANRMEVSDRFPMLGFTIRPDGDDRQAEIAIATDPALFRFESASVRQPSTFWSSRGIGPLPIAREEAVFIVPPEVLSRFVGHDKLYYALATFGRQGPGNPEIAALPSQGSPYINLKGFTGRSLRRIRTLPSRQRSAAGYGKDGDDLAWAGDAARPGTQPATPGSGNGAAPPAARPNGAAGPAASEPVQSVAVQPSQNASPGPDTSGHSAPAAASLNYDDGFGPLLPLPKPANGTAARPVHALDQDAFSINWDDVQLVPQPSNYSCWAAAAAMVVGWRDSMSLSPESVAAICHRTTATGLDPAQVGQFAQEIGLIAEPPACYPADSIRQMLTSYGPLWIGADVPGLHAIVVTGMYSDGSNTYVRISDPWDRAAGTPGAPGNYANTHTTGSRYILTWADFVTEFERAPLNNGTVNLQILHAASAALRTPNTGRTTVYAAAAAAPPPRQRDARLAHLPVPGPQRPSAKALIIDVDDVEQAQRYAPAWSDLFNWVTPAAVVSAIAARNMTVQRIQDASGLLNLDRYEVRVTRLPDGYDGAGLLRQVRLNLNDFVDTRNSEFIPYAVGTDDVKWASASPVGAVFKIDIIGPDNAAVVGSLVEDQRWRFTTIHTEWSGDHPVSGHREFGMRRDGDDYVFYTRGADRATDGIGETIAFAGADHLWRSFQSKLVDYVNNNGGEASASAPFSQRFHPAVVRILYGTAASLGAGGASAGTLSAADVQARADARSPMLAEAVRSAFQQGATEAEVAELLDQLKVPSGTATAVATALEGGEPYTQAAPQASVTGWRAGVIIGALAALSGPFAPMLIAAPALATAGNCCIAFGPAVEAGFAIGVGGGYGIVFGPGPEIGLYGTLEAVNGALASLSAAATVTVTRGDLAHFAGTGVAVGFNVEVEGPTLGVKVMLDPAGHLHGIGFRAGVGLTLTPLEVYAAVERTYVAQANALAMAASASNLPSPPPPHRRSSQAMDAGVVEIASVIAGAAMQRLVNNTGSITWQLDQLRDLKHPNDQAPSPQAAFRDAQTIRLDDWPLIENQLTDQIWAHFGIDWQYNGRSLGKVRISPIGTNEAVGWSLSVTAQIMDDAIVYPPSAPSFAALRIRFTYIFRRMVGSDSIAVVDLHLFGDGQFERDSRWLQY